MGRLSNDQKAMQQQIAAGADRSSRELGGPSKAELRASIPDYDPAMIKKLPPKNAPKKRGHKN